LNFTGIIAGTNSGSIKVFPHIFTGIPFETIPAHDGEVTNIVISPDGRFVFTSGNDGSIFIF
jgi:WD40 repeat protein